MYTRNYDCQRVHGGVAVKIIVPELDINQPESSSATLNSCDIKWYHITNFISYVVKPFNALNARQFAT